MQEYDVLAFVIRESVSLAILLAVLFGIYRLTKQFLALFLEQIENCCDELGRIANALNDKKRE